MNLIHKIQDQFNQDFDLDEDDCFDLMSAVIKLLKNTTYNNLPINQATKNLVAIAVTYGQPTVGGSRCDYTISDLLNAVIQQFQITSVKLNYVQFLKQGISKYALNPDREYRQLSAVLHQISK